MCKANAYLTCYFLQRFIAPCATPAAVTDLNVEIGNRGEPLRNKRADCLRHCLQKLRGTCFGNAGYVFRSYGVRISRGINIALPHVRNGSR